MKISNMKTRYTGKNPLSATASQYLQVGAGVCIMPIFFFGNYLLIDFFNAVTGWDPDSGQPQKSTLEKLGLAELIKTHG